MSPEEANLALLKSNINDLALELEQKAKGCRLVASNLDNIDDKIAERLRALELENLAARLKEMI